MINAKLVNVQNTYNVADFIKQGLFLNNLEKYDGSNFYFDRPWND